MKQQRGTKHSKENVRKQFVKFRRVQPITLHQVSVSTKVLHLSSRKLGFTRVYFIFHISAQNIDCGYLLEPPRRGSSNEYHNRRGGSNEYPQSMF